MLVITAALANPGVLQAAPHVPNVQLNQTVVIGPSVIGFTELEGGTPLVFDRRGAVGFAFSASVQGYHLAVPAEKRSHTGFRSVGATAWALFEPRTRLHHAFGIGGQLSPTPGGVFALVVQDVTSSLSIDYRLTASGKRVDVGIAAQAGVNPLTLLHFTVVPSVAVHLGPVDLEASVMGGIQPLAAASLGARVEPVEGLQIGLTAYGVAPVGSPFHVMPQLVVRYRAKWKKSAAGVPETGWDDVLR